MLPQLINEFSIVTATATCTRWFHWFTKNTNVENKPFWISFIPLEFSENHALILRFFLLKLHKSAHAYKITETQEYGKCTESWFLSNLFFCAFFIWIKREIIKLKQFIKREICYIWLELQKLILN